MDDRQGKDGFEELKNANRILGVEPEEPGPLGRLLLNGCVKLWAELKRVGELHGLFGRREQSE